MLALFVLIALWLSPCLFLFLSHSLSTLEQWGPCQRCHPSCFTATCSLGFRIQTPALSPASQSYRRITANTKTPQSKSEASGVGFNSKATKKARYQLNRIISCLINVLVANEIFAGGWRERSSVWKECHVKKKRRTEKTFNAPEHKNKTICRCWSGYSVNFNKSAASIYWMTISVPREPHPDSLLPTGFTGSTLSWRNSPFHLCCWFVSHYNWDV